MRLDDFLDIAVHTTAPDALWAASTRWLAAQGFDKIVHLSAGSGGVMAQTTLGNAFEEHYRSQNLARVDPFPRYCVPAPHAIATGADYLTDYAYLSADEKQVINAAADAGFRAGFSAVVRRDSQGWEAWNIGSSLARAEVEAIAREEGRTIRLGLMALRGRLAAPADVGLTARERACLELIADGYRTKAVARELGLAEVTVELHLKNARIKLGAVTRDHAVRLFLAQAGR